MVVELSKLKRILKIHKIKFNDYSNEDLKALIDYKLSEIEALTGLRINNTPLSDDFFNFKGRICALYDYPVRNIDQIKIDDYIIKDYSYTESGIINFEEPIRGHLHIDYTIGFNNNSKKKYIEPLIIDMIIFFFTFGTSGAIISEKEYGISSSYDVNTTLGHKINKQLSHLKRMYSGRVRMI